MKKFRKLALALCLAMVFLLPGCSSNNNQSASKTTLYWWSPKNDASQATLQQIAAQYMGQNPQVRIEIVTVDPRNYKDQVTTALASYQTINNAPDVFSIDVMDLPAFAPQLVPAADGLFDSFQGKNQKSGKTSAQYVEELYVSVVSKSCILNDSSGNKKVYGLPMGLDTLLLYTNNNAIQKAIQALRDRNKIDGALSVEQLNAITKQMQTPPTTWTQLTKIVPYLTTRNGEEITQSAIALGSSINVERSADILQSMMLQNGTQMTSADQNAATFNLATAQPGTATGSANPGLRALDFYTQFSNPQSSLYTWNDKMPNDVEAFEQGQVAMIVHYSDLYRYLIAEAPSIKNSLDVQPLPQAIDPASPLAAEQVKTMAKMNIQVASSAKGDATKQQASWDFIHYITSKQGANTYTSAMKLASPLKAVPGQPKFQASNTQKTWADLWYKGVKPLDVDQDFIGMVNDVATKKKLNKEALDQAAKDVSVILSGSKVKWPNANQSTNATTY